MALPFLVGALIGLGIAKVKPDLVPGASTTYRSAAKAVIRGGLTLLDSMQELVAEGAEHLSDLVAEVQYERTASAAPETEQKAEAA
jgi:hypothetical protein